VGARLSLVALAYTHVCGAPASRARGTTRRRRGDGGCGVRRRRDGSLHKSGSRPDGEREYPRAGYGRVIGIAGSTREKGGGGGAHR
jgi:hypothetical protein